VGRGADAVPCEVASTKQDGEHGILRLCFPKAKNRNDDSLKEIDWDAFFSKFDENGLSLVYQEKTAGGARSNFNKLIHADSQATSHSSQSSASRSGAGRSGSSRTSGSESGSSSRGRSTRKSSGSSHGHTSSRHHAA
jgi:hypothetical protein